MFRRLNAIVRAGSNWQKYAFYTLDFSVKRDYININKIKKCYIIKKFTIHFLYCIKTAAVK